MGAVKDKIEDFAFDAKCKFREIRDSVQDIFHQDSNYTPRQNISSGSSIANTNEISEWKEKVRKKTEEKERLMLDHLSAYNDLLLKELEKVNTEEFGGEKLNLNIDQIKQKSEQIKKNAVGSAARVVDDRFVQTDPELSEILKEPNDALRKKKYREFSDRIAALALTNMRKESEKAVDEQSKLIRNEIITRKQQVEKSLRELISELNSIQEKKNQNDSDTAAEKIKYIYAYTLSSLLLDELA